MSTVVEEPAVANIAVVTSVMLMSRVKSSVPSINASSLSITITLDVGVAEPALNAKVTVPGSVKSAGETAVPSDAITSGFINKLKQYYTIF